MNRRAFIASAFAFVGGGCAFTGRSLSRHHEDVAAEIRRQIGQGYFSCACCGNQDGEIWTIGNARPECGMYLPVGRNSLFEVASISKLFTASLVAILYCEGKLDIDAPFTDCLPEHILSSEGTDITIRDIASHCAGFGDGWFYGDLRSRRVYQTPETFRRGVLAAMPVAKRRERCRYACHNMILLGYVIERVCGLDLDAAAKKYLWRPLAMNSTTWRNIPGDGRVVQTYTSGAVEIGMKGDEKARVSDLPIGNAGVFTSLDDMMLFAADLLKREAFPDEYYRLIFTPQFESGSARRTFGWNMPRQASDSAWSDMTVSHSGYTGQYIAVDPKRETFAVVLTNDSSQGRKRRAESYSNRLKLAAMVV